MLLAFYVNTINSAKVIAVSTDNTTMTRQSDAQLISVSFRLYEEITKTPMSFRCIVAIQLICPGQRGASRWLTVFFFPSNWCSSLGTRFALAPSAGSSESNVKLCIYKKKKIKKIKIK